jgi:hypothetical protein
MQDVVTGSFSSIANAAYVVVAIGIISLVILAFRAWRQATREDF